MVRQRAWKDECFYSGNREEISPTLVSLRKDRETCPGTDAHWDSIRLRSELCTPRAFIPRQAEAIIQANASQQHHFWPVTSMRNNYILGSKINEWLSQMVVPCCIRYPSPSFLTVPRLLLSLFLVLSFFLSFFQSPISSLLQSHLNSFEPVHSCASVTRGVSACYPASRQGVRFLCQLPCCHRMRKINPV